MNFERVLLEIMEDERKAGKIEIIKEMLKNHMSDEQIIKITKIDKTELAKLKMA